VAEAAAAIEFVERGGDVPDDLLDALHDARLFRLRKEVVT